jgi:predicted RNA-binding Zn-ribbon protein involved in translation (DUF1610 family)
VEIISRGGYAVDLSQETHLSIESILAANELTLSAVPDPSNRLLPANRSTVAILFSCTDCRESLEVTYEFQGRERKNVYRCPHCQQLGQIALPGPIVLPIAEA